MEFILTIAIFLLAAGGLALGLALGRGPAQTSCDGLACLKSASCSHCPNKGHESGEEGR